jgi:hypothetical protein
MDPDPSLDPDPTPDMDPTPDPDPIPDPTPFFSDFKDGKKILIFLLTYPLAQYLQS